MTTFGFKQGAGSKISMICYKAWPYLLLPNSCSRPSSGGVRGVALVHSPLLGTKGRVSMDMMHATDWVPTLYGLAGGNTSKLENLDGFDMWPTLAHGEQNPRTEILLNIDGDDSALRFQQWKFVNTSNVHLSYFF